MDIDELYAEIQMYREEVKVKNDPTERLHDNYYRVVAIMQRVGEIRDQISYLEMKSRATREETKFRTTIIDPFILELKEVAKYESRKITAVSVEAQLER